LQVRDDGAGLPSGKSTALKEGVGLANTKARLQRLYGAASRFELHDADGGGLLVKLSIPWRTKNGNSLNPAHENTDIDR
jgi:sensor histidine kinase YesM